VGQNPEVKALFLSGRINVAVCPQCGHAGQLSAPLVYHDASKELLLTYVPPELSLDNLEQQRAIGDLTKRVMSTLPADQRKGYLLNPRDVLTLEGMMQAILEADGITQEMLDAQREKAELLEQLISIDSAEERRSIVDGKEELIDVDFFELLELNVEAAHANEREDIARQLLGLRSELLESTAVGRDIKVREDAIKELGSEITRENLLEKLVEAALSGEAIKVKTMVTFARPAIDYQFYQQLTSRIEAAQTAADPARTKTLVDLRDTILDLTAEIDAEIQLATEQASNLIREIVRSEDLESALRSNAGRIDELFMNALALSLRAAEESNRTADAEKLRQVAELTMQLLEESQPPELRLINNLLRADYPEETKALLENNREQINPQFLEIMRMVGADFTQSGRKELAQQLAQVREQAAAFVLQADVTGV
jgi:hypothetical protein